MPLLLPCPSTNCCTLSGQGNAKPLGQYTKRALPTRYSRGTTPARGGSSPRLAAVGLFGVLAFTVRQRTREIGIRIALGAEVRNVLMGTLKSGLTQVVSGLGMGVLLALALSPLVRGLFYAEQILDWRVYGLVGAMMLGTGFVASLVPAARAVRIDPAEALRRE